MAARIIKPISSSEFAGALRASRPLTGWSNTLAVANSGGPDSTCLLFLLNRHIKEGSNEKTGKKLPRELVSITVDHDLQESSAGMADIAAKTAEALSIRHFTEKLPWGQDNYPSKPKPGESLEEKARDLRQNLFFEKMNALNANALAMGHHCDDQVETMLMRLGRNSGLLGLAGMRPCRRMGTGISTIEKSDEQMWAEMKKWIVRPLLAFGKDRILATCEGNKLEYATDPTNFQPDLTIRNAIRHILANGGAAGVTADDPSFHRFPRAIASRLADINIASQKYPDLNINLTSDIEHLRETNKKLSDRRNEIDDEVSEIIAGTRVTSPSGTFAIPALVIDQMDSEVKEALLYRITRFVSPEPWGSPSAELGRRSESMERLVKHMSQSMGKFRKGDNSIVVGSRVWWRLATITKVNYKTTLVSARPQDLVWVAIRQPEKRAGGPEGKAHPLRIDCTSQIVSARQAWLAGEGPNEVGVLFDRRFIIRFHLDKLPDDIVKLISEEGKISLRNHQVWLLPKVQIIKKKKATIIHTEIIPDGPSKGRPWGIKESRKMKVDWITIENIRPLSAI